MLTYIDIHAHLHDKAFDEDREEVIAAMKEQGIGAITIGTDYEQSKQALSLAKKHGHLWATVGFHPVDNETEVFDVTKYEELTKDEKVVAIGECGLDYYWPNKDGAMSDEEKQHQKNIFIKHIELAIRVGKPLMIHARPSKGSMDAYEDTLTILETYKGIVRGNFHFFVGTEIIAKRAEAISFTVSFPGVITFAKEVEDVARVLPLHMVHGETDSPYATPVPHRGKRNSPLNVPFIIKKIADVQGLPEEEVIKTLRNNAVLLFGLTLPV